MYNDEIFGVLDYNIMWNRKENYTLYGKDYEIILFIQGDENASPTETQRQAYVEFNKVKTLLQEDIEQKIFEYYQTVCKEYREMYDETADLYAPLVDNYLQLKGYVKPMSIMIPRTENERVVNILFKTKWDLELGIGIKIVNENIEFVGVEADVL